MNYKSHVEKQIMQQNQWYMGDQIEWSNLPEIKPIYDDRKNFLAKILAKKQKSKKNIKVLDCGCGDGYWTSIFTQIEGLEVTAIDYNDLRLERAQKNAPKAKFIISDIQTLSEKTADKFDLIWFSQVIEHIEDDVSILKAFHNVLAEDGTLVVGTTNEGCFLYEKYQERTNYRKDSDHVHFYTLKEIKAKLKLSGYKIESALYEPFFPGDEAKFYKWMRKPRKRLLLKILSQIFPSGCTDYYFECTKK